MANYKLSVTAADADSALQAALALSQTTGIIRADGAGGVEACIPGEDYGYPLLQGNGIPTNATAASIGQHYFNLSATAPPYEYICVGFNATGFVWLVFGDAGTGFIISGYFATLEALETAISEELVPAPTKGVAYGIGEAIPYDVYIWDEVNSQWVNTGPLSSSTGEGLPPHGTTGQALVKVSDVDYDAGWGPVSDISPGAVDTEQLNALAVTTDKLSDASVTRSKQAADALYSPVATAESREISVSDLGVYLTNPWDGPAQYTLTQTVSTLFPTGAELPFFRSGQSDAASLSLVSEGVRFALYGEPELQASGTVLQIPEYFGSFALKKISADLDAGDVWLVIGTAEVAS